MKAKIELKFTGIEPVYVNNNLLVICWRIYFEDKDGGKYILLLEITETALAGWRNLPQEKTKRESVFFQAGVKHIEKKILQNTLEEMLWARNYKYTIDSNNVEDYFSCDPERALPQFPFQRVFWQRPGDPLERKNEERNQFLLRIYELSDGNIAMGYDPEGILEQLDIPLDQKDSISFYLYNEGLIDMTRDDVMIKHKGIKEAEKYLEKIKQTESHLNFQSSALKNKKNESQKSQLPSAFISYSQKDKHFARKIKQMLEQAGARVWIDEMEMRVGDSMMKQISSAIKENQYLIAVLSQNSVKSEWVKTELRWAMDHELKAKRVKVLPILLENCEVPLFLADKFYADFSSPEKYEQNYLKLLKAMSLDVSDVQHKITEVEDQVPPIKDYVEIQITKASKLG